LTGTTIKNLSLNIIKNTVITKPSIIEQQKIADFLTLLDGRIDKQQAKLEALKEQKKGLCYRRSLAEM